MQFIVLNEVKIVRLELIQIVAIENEADTILSTLERNVHLITVHRAGGWLVGGC